jgi:hypothetical protein
MRGDLAGNDRTSTTETKCPRCGEQGVAADFFHSADGLICESCHKLARTQERKRDTARDGDIEAMLNGLLAVAMGFGAISFIVFLPRGPTPSRTLGVFGTCILVAMFTRVRAGRLAKIAPHGALWRRVATFGALLAGCALVAALLFLRLAPAHVVGR